MEEYLKPTEFLDFDNPQVREFARLCAKCDGITRIFSEAKNIRASLWFTN